MVELHEFLDVVHPEGAPGFIEVRVIGEAPSNRGKVHDRRWFDGPKALLEALPEIQAAADANTAGIYMGVLPRRAKGAGKADDILPGSVAWVDVDFKDLEHGESEARERLEAFAARPTVVVASGHGLHLYWGFDQEVDPGDLGELCWGLSQALGGDSAHDPARVLRLPGTTNWKDPNAPIQSRIEVLDPGLRHHPGELRELGPVPEPRVRQRESQAHGAWTYDHEAELDPRILGLLDQKRRVRSLFEGKGKPAIDDNGRRLDGSTSGYDYSLLLELLRAGVDEPALLANALVNRPDQVAREKGKTYVRRTVDRAIARHEQGKRSVGGEVVDFRVDAVTVLVADRRRFQLQVEGRVLALTTQELMSPAAFRNRFVDAIGRVPRVPGKRDDWSALVNEWMASAEEVELPPDASDTHALREAVERAVRGLPVGEDADDLDNGLAVEKNGRRLVRTETLFQALRDSWPTLTRYELAAVLRELGAESKAHRLGEDVVRAWQVPVTPIYAREENKHRESQQGV